MSGATSLSNVQQELLKLYSFNVADADLINIRRYLAKYFATKAIEEADQIWDQNGYNKETMNSWLNEGNFDHDKGGQ